MSDPIYPLEPWQQNTLDNSIPANTNWLREEAVNRRVLSKTTTAQPGSPSDGDVYIIPAAATGLQWSTFSQNDIAIYRGGTWYAYAPVPGLIVNLAGTLQEYTTGGGWQAPSGLSVPRNTVTALSIAAGVVNIDCSLGDYFTISLTANVTSITFSNLPGSGKGAALIIRLQQDGTGSRTVALPSSFKAITGSDTAVQSAANAYTILSITTLDNGTRWEYSMKAGAA